MQVANLNVNLNLNVNRRLCLTLRLGHCAIKWILWVYSIDNRDTWLECIHDFGFSFGCGSRL